MAIVRKSGESGIDVTIGARIKDPAFKPMARATVHVFDHGFDIPRARIDGNGESPA
jgi:hypothetical protein